MSKEIIEEANYCLDCKNKPCQKGCPLNNDTAGFIQLVKEEKYKEAYELLCETTVLQPVCGRICPHERQCEGNCVRGIKGEPVQIGKLEAFVGDLAVKNNWKIDKKKNKADGKKVAVIGAGPSGLTASAFLTKHGYDVTIYEKNENLGGILYYGIPEFRLPKKVLKNTIDKILELGIRIKTNCKLGQDISINQLESEYDAIYLSFGANKSIKMNISGENLKGVYGANELLENNLHPNYKGKTVVVIGGGNVAMDSARTIKKLGAEKVIIIYRRSEKEMPADKKEIEEAKNEKIEFLFQNNIVKIMGKDKVEKIECVKTNLVHKDGENRLIPINIEDSNYFLEADYVVAAVGSKTEKDTVDKLGIELSKNKKIIVNEKNQTSKEKIFAGGDVTQSSISTVAWAARSGRNAAESMIEFLEKY